MNNPPAPRPGTPVPSMRLLGVAIILAIVLPAAPVPAKDRAVEPTCDVAMTLTGTVARGGPHGEVVLSDGTSLRPADLWIEDGGAILPEGAHVTYRRAARSADRWGRWPARIMLTEAGSAEWLGQRLVSEGRALVRPESAEAGCIGTLLKAEVQARTASRGIWADGSHPVAADNLARLSQKVGTYVVAEGFVHTVGVRARQTYLNFGRRWTENLTVAMPKSLWTQAASRSMTAPILEGRRLRVRGVLERGSGPMIRLGRLDEIELLGDR